MIYLYRYLSNQVIYLGLQHIFQFFKMKTFLATLKVSKLPQMYAVTFCLLSTWYRSTAFGLTGSLPTFVLHQQFNFVTSNFLFVYCFSFYVRVVNRSGHLVNARFQVVYAVKVWCWSFEKGGSPRGKSVIYLPLGL